MINRNINTCKDTNNILVNVSIYQIQICALNQGLVTGLKINGFFLTGYYNKIQVQEPKAKIAIT